MFPHVNLFLTLLSWAQSKLRTQIFVILRSEQCLLLGGTVSRNSSGGEHFSEASVGVSQPTSQRHWGIFATAAFIVVTAPHFARTEIEVVAGEKTEISVQLKLDQEAVNALLAEARGAYASQQYDKAIRLSKDILSTDPKQAQALSILAECYFMTNDFENFEEFAGQALDAGGQIRFTLNHHHNMLGLFGRSPLHRIELILSANTVSFDPQVTNEMECSYKAFTVSLGAVAAVELAGNPGDEVYLRLKFFKDLANPKKTAELKFTDRESSLEVRQKTTAGGLIGYPVSVLVSRREASQAMKAIKDVFDREVHPRENSATATMAEGDRLYRQGIPETLRKAIEKYQEALSLFRALGDRDREARSLHNIAVAYSSLGDMRKAIDFGSQALLFYRSTGDRHMEASTLSIIATASSGLGERQKTIDFANQALLLYRSTGNREMEAFTLNQIAGAYDDLGEKQKALDLEEEALVLWRKLGNRSEESRTITFKGAIYASLGETQKALDYSEQAIQLQRAVRDRQGEANTLNFIGVVNLSQDEKKKALGYHNQALKLFRAISNRRGEGDTLMNIGNCYLALGEKQKALSNLNKALQSKRGLGDRRGEAITLAIIAEVYGELGEKQKAYDLGTQALQLFQTMGVAMGEAHAHFRFAQAWRDEGNLLEARNHIEKALDLAESMRANVINQELRSSYFASAQEYYEFYIDLLMQLHKQRPSEGLNAVALHISERARARSLLELLAEAHADIRQGVDPTLVERERSLQQRLNSRAEFKMKIHSGSLSEEQTSAIDKEMGALMTEFQQVETQIRQSSPRYAALTQPQPLRLEEIQTQVLDTDTLLLEYSLGKDRSYLWAVTPDSITSYELPKRNEIEKLALEIFSFLKINPSELQERRALRDSALVKEKTSSAVSKLSTIATLDPESSDVAIRLSQAVLGPVASQLGKKRLLIVADGALQFIPFGALPISHTTTKSSGITDQQTNALKGQSSGADYRPLIIEHEIVSLPSASTLAILRSEMTDRRPAEKLVAAIADPVFEATDSRLATKVVEGVRNNSERSIQERSVAMLGLIRSASRLLKN